MKSSFALLAAITAIVLTASAAQAADLPRNIPVAACQKPPTIDGTIGDDEWAAAKPIEFDMAFLHVKSQKLGKRAATLRVMNSANGIYFALTVPDETANKTLAPLNIDFAMLAFCRGKELAAGDDRKTVGPSIYIDKHVTTPGKDADDKRQDGKGAMVQSGKVCTVEWAFPLDSGDAEDFQAKPGDSLRFNLAYFDGFQPDLKETQIGAAYQGGLDNAANWGTLQLAAQVQDDGGAAFQGPAWVADLFKEFKTPPANRLRLQDSVQVAAGPQPVVKALVEYKFRDPQGKETIGKAKLYLPGSVRQGKQRLPLYYSAGYELDDNSALAQVARGMVVVTPRELPANPLVRTVNPDAALLHLVRSLPFVDDARVVIAGNSAGGYITLMLAAETFPLAGAAPDVPPLNWGYNAAYFLQRERQPQGAAADANAPKIPVFDVIVPIVKQSLGVYGDDTNSAAYFANSPLAHLPTVTCPVSAYWSTADMLVPIDQVGTQWIHPFDAQTYPTGFTMDREKLTTSADGRKRLTDVLKDSDYELFVVPEATITRQLAEFPKSMLPVDFGDSATRQWSITILDEGAPASLLGHLKHNVPRVHKSFLDRVLSAKISPAQLTPTKLERLLDRYSGKEWLPAGLVHLDDPEVERADVLRGLQTYVAAGPENANLFAELYGKLPAARKVLPEDVVARLSKN